MKPCLNIRGHRKKKTYGHGHSRYLLIHGRLPNIWVCLKSLVSPIPMDQNLILLIIWWLFLCASSIFSQTHIPKKSKSSLPVSRSPFLTMPLFIQVNLQIPFTHWEDCKLLNQNAPTKLGIEKRSQSLKLPDSIFANALKIWECLKISKPYLNMFQMFPTLLSRVSAVVPTQLLPHPTKWWDLVFHHTRNSIFLASTSQA